MPEEDNPYGLGSAQVKAALADCTKDGIATVTCAWHDYRESRKALDVSVRAVKKGLVSYPRRLGLFVRAQAEWIDFRNADCDFDAAGGDGPDGQLVWSEEYSCRTSLTRTRTRQLRAFALCLQRSDCESPKFFYDTSQ